ncbi:MAG: hypothetical protein H8E44_23990 [Planctomycetes bacterium]|nr:hypothetical protein [Planctomycetota bacterium]MBL7040876.1 hypothetical protein [Pirellulaceae bacterium]
MHDKMAAPLSDLHCEFGLKSRLISLLGGPYVLRQIRREEKRLAAGWTREPPTFYERKLIFIESTNRGGVKAGRCRNVSLRMTRVPTRSETVAERKDMAGVG